MSASRIKVVCVHVVRYHGINPLENNKSRFPATFDNKEHRLRTKLFKGMKIVLFIVIETITIAVLIVELSPNYILTAILDQAFQHRSSASTPLQVIDIAGAVSDSFGPI
ncbi:hypothetical protein JTE90_001611 [Oedothorax gibbosus]|uniref:Uncharacterized protein n=1 Tax=Oedothorax gibbosus TaxID=931172 RepID=A0AAV6VPC4_9ARAC|nr:hypothetical protein JTE90_001611 [Oedothorax gibbosus]